MTTTYVQGVALSLCTSDTSWVSWTWRHLAYILHVVYTLVIPVLRGAWRAYAHGATTTSGTWNYGERAHGLQALHS